MSEDSMVTPWASNTKQQWWSLGIQEYLTVLNGNVPLEADVHVIFRTRRRCRSSEISFQSRQENRNSTLWRNCKPVWYWGNQKEAATRRSHRLKPCMMLHLVSQPRCFQLVLTEVTFIEVMPVPEENLNIRSKILKGIYFFMLATLLISISIVSVYCKIYFCFVLF